MDPGTTAPATPTWPTCGFVGTGMMGGRMAQNLLRAGVPLVVHNRSRERAEPLLKGGARWAESPAHLGRAVPGGIVFLMLADGAAVRRVLWGPRGLARAATPGTLVVDHSTVSPEESRRAAERLSARGVHFLDAPVGGSIGPAERAELTFLVGGAPMDLERARPFLERMGQRIEPIGPVGSGSSMKLVNNLLTIGTVGLLSEALAVAEGLGLERPRVVELLRRGGGASAMLEGKHRNLESRTYPPEFLLGLARKDLRLIERSAGQAGVATAFARQARRLCDAALRSGHDHEDFSSIAEAARRRSPSAEARPAMEG